MKTIISLALVALLTACGGGGSDTPAEQPLPPAPVVSRHGFDTLTATIAIYGDSLVNLEAAKLRVILPQSQVINHAVPGLRIQSLALVQDETADVTVIAFGTNDARANPANPTAEQFEAQLLAAVTDRQTAGHTVVIETPPRTTKARATGWAYADGVARFADAARAVAARTGATLCDRESASMYWPDSAYLPDGVHYVDATDAAEMLAACVRDALQDAAMTAPKVTP